MLSLFDRNAKVSADQGSELFQSLRYMERNSRHRREERQ
jgi:hypothetical protein